MKEKFTSCIMDRKTVGLILTILLSLVGNSAFAYSFKAENSDGVVIYYNLINDETELEVTGQDARRKDRCKEQGYLQSVQTNRE